MSNQSGVVYYICSVFMLVMLAIFGLLSALFLGLAYGAYRHESPHEGLEITGWICLGMFGCVFSTLFYFLRTWGCCPSWCYPDRPFV